jgi:hypothetical protein
MKTYQYFLPEDELLGGVEKYYNFIAVRGWRG